MVKNLVVENYEAVFFEVTAAKIPTIFDDIYDELTKVPQEEVLHLTFTSYLEARQTAATLVQYYDYNIAIVVLYRYRQVDPDDPEHTECAESELVAEFLAATNEELEAEKETEAEE